MCKFSQHSSEKRGTKCLKDHHVDTTKKLKEAPKEWQELVVCDRERVTRERGRLEVFTVVLKSWGFHRWRTSGALHGEIPLGPLPSPLFQKGRQHEERIAWSANALAGLTRQQQGDKITKHAGMYASTCTQNTQHGEGRG